MKSALLGTPCRRDTAESVLGLVGVVPIVPTIQILTVLLPLAVVSLLAALASLRHPQVARQLLRFLWHQKLSLVALVLAVVMVTWGVAQLPAVWRSVGEPSSGGDWPMYQGGLERWGATAGARGPAGGGMRWEIGGRNEAFYSSPAIVGNRVYVVGSQGDRGRIYCLDRDSGSVVWSCRPPGYRATFSSPVVAGSLLVCGEGLHDAKMARVVCVDLRPRRAGQLAWSFQTNSHVECTPIVIDDRVYVAAGDDGVYCLALDPNLPDDRRVIWHAPGSQFPDAETSLAVQDNRVYVGLGVGGNAICVLDADSGVELKRLAMPYPVFSPPSIADGKLYVGMGVGDYVTPDRDPSGQVCCIDLETFQVDWRYELNGTVLGSIAIADGRLLLGASNGVLYELSRDGQLLNQWNSYAPIVASPAVTDQHVYIVNQQGMLFGLDRQRWDLVWQHRVGEPGRYVGSPAVADGSVFVGSDRDRFQRLGEPLEGTRQSHWPGAFGGAGIAGCRDGSLLPTRPVIAWRFPEHGIHAYELRGMSLDGPVAPGPDCLVGVFRSPVMSKVVCLQLSTATRPDVRWSHTFYRPIEQSASVAGDLALIVGSHQIGHRRLIAFDLQSGQARWHVDVDAEVSGVQTADSDGVVVQSRPGYVDYYDLTGRRRWTQPAGRLEHGVAITPAMIAMATSEPAALQVLDRLTGRLLWRGELTDAPGSAPVIVGTQVAVATQRGLQMYSLVDGRPLRMLSEVAIIGEPLFIDTRRYAYLGTNDTLVLGDLDGRTHAVRPTGGPVRSLLVTANAVLYSGPNQALHRLDPLQVDSLSSPWFTGYADRSMITEAAILADGRVYLSAGGRGLVCLKGVAP